MRVEAEGKPIPSASFFFVIGASWALAATGHLLPSLSKTPQESAEEWNTASPITWRLTLLRSLSASLMRPS